MEAYTCRPMIKSRVTILITLLLLLYCYTTLSKNTTFLLELCCLCVTVSHWATVPQVLDDLPMGYCGKCMGARSFSKGLYYCIQSNTTHNNYRHYSRTSFAQQTMSIGLSNPPMPVYLYLQDCRSSVPASPAVAFETTLALDDWLGRCEKRVNARQNV